ncbi:MAG: SDR family NAD(P)-dependent oxidoreductase, partial [Gammaproteobacteria bacterium]|nr:SDR family NAD(P)-dependent oxidoreductase [Gammaproteobacteria bacterium]
PHGNQPRALSGSHASHGNQSGGTETSALVHYTLNPRQPGDYETLIEELHTHGKMPQTIVHLWTVTQDEPQIPVFEYFEKMQELGFYSLLFLTQALGKRNVTDDIRIEAVSNHVQAVSGEEALHPEKATLLGPVKVIGREYPNLHCRSIDVVLPSAVHLRQDTLIPACPLDSRVRGNDGTEVSPLDSRVRGNDGMVEQLMAELSTPSADQIIAYRDGQRRVQSYEPIRLQKPLEKLPGLRLKGVYLITGGLGGIGLALAEYLAETVQAKLILTGRSALPAGNKRAEWLANHDEHNAVSRKIRKVQALEALGAEVLAVGADAADRLQMQKVILAAEQRFGPVNGVIHSAGIADGALIQRRTQAMTEAVFAAKVKGAIVLDTLLQKIELDFFILCSSLASIFGISGQVGYCAANAFLDAFAHVRNAKGDGFTAAINWDTWQEVGMAVESVRNPSSVLENLKLPWKETREVSHPLFDECFIDSDGQENYISRLNMSRHWVLEDHRIMGKAVLPGTACLELARAAFATHAQAGAIEIRDVYFLRPLTVEGSEYKEVHTRLSKQGDRFEFTISSRSGEGDRQEHAKGFIACIAAEADKKHDIKAIERECARQEIIIDPGFAQKP